MPLKDEKIHYGLEGKPICNLHKRRAATAKPLKITLDREKVTCKRCRSTFYKEN